MIRNYANVAQPTSLTSDVGINDTTLPVVSTAGYPSVPFTISLERGEANEEVVLVQGKTGTSFTDCVRGYDGTDKNAHLSTSVVEHVVAAIDYREANLHVNATTPADNPHPQYVRSAELATSVSSLGLAVPIGSLVPYLGTTSPSSKWLIPNGAAVSRSAYPELFALVGETFGAGDGVSTFNLPDLRGRVLMALDNLGGAAANVVNATAARTLGGTLGSHTQALVTANLPAHTHPAGTLSATTSGSSHTHGASTGTAGNHRHAGIGANGVETTFENTTMYAYPGFGVGQTIANWTAIAGNHTHSVTVNTSGSTHTHTISGSTGSTGSATPVNMLQPTFAVGYLLRALA